MPTPLKNSGGKTTQVFHLAFILTSEDLTSFLGLTGNNARNTPESKDPTQKAQSSYVPKTSAPANVPTTANGATPTAVAPRALHFTFVPLY